MAQNAWNFAHYTCGHQTPVRGGDRHLAYHCPDCRASERDPYNCPRCHDTKSMRNRFCGGDRCRQAKD